MRTAHYLPTGCVTILLAASLSPGCAQHIAHDRDAAPAARADADAPATDFSVSLQIDALGKADVAPRTIKPGEVLHSGDHFSLGVAVDAPRQVYVVRYAQSGWSTQLFPRGTDASVKPGASLRLPLEGSAYRLDDTEGTEVLYVAASSQPMSRTLCGELRLPCLHELGDDPVRGEPPPPPPPPPPPDGVPDAQRKPELIFENKQYTLRQRSDRAGLALLKFAFEHRP